MRWWRKSQGRKLEGMASLVQVEVEAECECAHDDACIISGVMGIEISQAHTHTFLDSLLLENFHPYRPDWTGLGWLSWMGHRTDLSACDCDCDASA